MQRFAERVVIVTGGTRGIGRAFVERFSSEGATLVITARTAKDLDKTVEELRASGVESLAVCGDMADPNAMDRIVERTLERFGRIDVLVNNAAVWDDAEFLEIELENWNHVLACNLTGPFLLAQRTAREMVKTGGGSIVNIASIDGHVADGPYASYGVAKAGLQGLTKYMAVALARHGIRCNSISPGYVDTPTFAVSAGPALHREMTRNFTRVPLGRLLSLDEIAAVCAFLASDEASGLTGADVVVDGGTLADAYIGPVIESLRAAGVSDATPV